MHNKNTYSKKRNQLIGFITLILIGLILAPYIFTDKSQQHRRTIPLLASTYQQAQAITNEANELAYIESIELAQIDHNEQENIIEQTATSQTKPTESQQNNHETNNAINNNQTVDKSYMIQLVALKNKQKIEELVALLLLNNYEVHTDPKNATQGQIIRLLVGPYSTKEQVETIIIDLEHLTKLTGIIVTQ